MIRGAIPRIKGEGDEEEEVKGWEKEQGKGREERCVPDCLISFPWGLGLKPQERMNLRYILCGPPHVDTREQTRYLKLGGRKISLFSEVAS